MALCFHTRREVAHIYGAFVFNVSCWSQCWEVQECIAGADRRGSLRITAADCLEGRLLNRRQPRNLGVADGSAHGAESTHVLDDGGGSGRFLPAIRRRRCRCRSPGSRRPRILLNRRRHIHLAQPLKQRNSVSTLIYSLKV